MRLLAGLLKNSTVVLMLPALLLILVEPHQAGGQSEPALVKASIDSGKVQLIYADGKTVEPPPEKGQASCESLKIAEDKMTLGWLVDYENGGTYPVALSLVVFRAKKVVQRFGNSDPDPIEDWQFRSGGTQVAFVTNALHGGGRAHYELHDVSKGTLLAKWDGPLNQQSPGWTRGLWDEDAE